MLHASRLVATAVLGALACGPAAAQGKPAPEKSRMCATCHGPVGMATLLNTPNLAGQPAVYLAEQLKAYRSGKRSNEMMTVIAKPLSDADIEELSAWYASVQVEVKSPP